MLEINFNQRKIEIDLPNGVYNLGILSGTGKLICVTLSSTWVLMDILCANMTMKIIQMANI